MPTSAEIEAALRRVAVFRDATDDDFRAMTALVTVRTVEAAAFLFTQSDPADYLYVLYSGRAKLCQMASDGQQVNLRTLYPDYIFGAVGAIDPAAVYPASAQALEESVALAIRSDRYRDFLSTRAYLAFGLMKLMTGYIQEMQSRYREMVTERVEQRIARALLRLATEGAPHEEGGRVTLRFSRQDLAEMVGTTLYTVSRTLSAWERQGLVATGRERVTLLRSAELNRLAEGEEGRSFPA